MEIFRNVPKTQLLILLIFFNCISPLLAQQPGFICTSTSNGPTNPPQAPQQPTNCIILLKDLAPSPIDRVLEVNVHFWVFAPTTNSANSVWTHTFHPNTQSDAQKCLDDANATYTNIPTVPHLIVAGTPTGVTNAKIKLILKDFTIVNNDAAYNDVTDVSGGNLGLTWFDPNAINVYMGTSGSDNIAAPGGAMFSIHFTAAFEKTVTPAPNISVLDNIGNYGNIFAHEVGHILGLQHTTAYFTNYPTSPSRTSVTPNYGCCSYIEINDVFLENFFATPTSGPIMSCNNPFDSDNLMCQAGSCNRYLSPQQMAVMHFNLRSNCVKLLSSNGYTSATVVDQNFNVEINQNTVWEDGNRYIKGNITVKAGKTLTIKCGLAMSFGAKILVEKGAQLVLDGGHITNVSGRIWEGIFVLGNPSQSQLQSHPTNIGAALYQGMLRIKNNGKICNAKVGVRNNSGSGWDAGGIIISDNGIFENNLVDVEFQTLGTFNTTYASASRFIRTQFKTTGYIGTNQLPISHVKLIKTDGVKFLGCTFQFSTSLYHNSGDGIYSTDAIYTVDNFGTYMSIFEGLMKGVFVNNINPLKAPIISNTKFISPKSCGAYFMNVNYLSFKTNTIQYNPTTYVQQAGVYLNNCKYYKITSNQFIQSNTITPSDPGISIYKSQAGAHEVYRNTFSGLLMGVNCMDNNSGATNITDGLRLNCNVFNSGLSNIYDIALTYTSGLSAPTVMKKQGEVLNSNSGNVVRNIYGASCGNQNKWYVSSTSQKAIDHGSNTNSVTAVTQPTPQPNCSNSLLNIVNSNINLDYPNHCPANPLSSGGGGTNSAQNIANINTYIGDLRENNQNNEFDFEIQSSVSSKLNIFLNDTLGPNMDSVIALLDQNQGNMVDADVQLVFAYILKHDFETANTKANALQSTKPNWKSFFIKLIELETDTVNGIFLLNSDQTKRNFFLTHSSTSNIDGQSNALALLKAACDSVYSEPHAVPEAYLERSANQYTAGIEESQSDETGYRVWLYPNPTSGDINVNVISNQKHKIHYIITDVIGKTVTSGQFAPNQAQEINCSQLINGIYFITVSQNNHIISKQKFIVLRH